MKRTANYEAPMHKKVRPVATVSESEEFRQTTLARVQRVTMALGQVKDELKRFQEAADSTSQAEESKQEILAQMHRWENLLEKTSSETSKIEASLCAPFITAQQAKKLDPKDPDQEVTALEERMRAILTERKENTQAQKEAEEAISERYRLAEEEGQSAQPRCDTQDAAILSCRGKKRALEEEYGRLDAARDACSTHPPLAKSPSLLWSQSSSSEPKGEEPASSPTPPTL